MLFYEEKPLIAMISRLILSHLTDIENVITYGMSVIFNAYYICPFFTFKENQENRHTFGQVKFLNI